MIAGGVTLLYQKEKCYGVIPGNFFGDLPYSFNKTQVDGALWGRMEYGWFFWQQQCIVAVNLDLSLKVFRAVDGEEEFATLFYPWSGFNSNASTASSCSWLFPRLGVKVGYRIR